MLDTFFMVLLFHGATVAAWAAEGYQDLPEHAAFACAPPPPPLVPAAAPLNVETAYVHACTCVCARSTGILAPVRWCARAAALRASEPVAWLHPGLGELRGAAPREFQQHITLGAVILAASGDVLAPHGPCLGSIVRRRNPCTESLFSSRK